MAEEQAAVTEESLMAMAQAIDSGEEVKPLIEGEPPKAEPIPDEKPPDPVPQKPPEEKPPDPKSPLAERPRGPDGKFLPKAEAPVAPVVDPVKPESAYDKAKKEEQRQRGVLANFEAEKAKVREHEAKLQEREQQLALVEAQHRPEATWNGFSAREYLQAADEFAKNNDFESAYKARDAAYKLQAHEQQYFAQQGAQSAQAAFTSGMDKYIKENPQWAYGDTPESKAVVSVLQEFPQIQWLPDGFEKACKAAQRFMDAESASELRTELETVKADLLKFQSATQPGVGGTGAMPSGPKKFADMSSAEQEAELSRMAYEADQGVG